MTEVGQMIKARREVAGLSQKRLGIACGLSDSEIMKIENGIRKRPNWDNLCRIAQVLKIHPFEILLVAGYISENDIHSCMRIRGLDVLNERELEIVQLFVDFIISKRNADGISEGGL